ncbi:CAAX amino terminal protease self- immunity [Polystyrenella longa]|uniref:CAAX amino terminal protease self-immunity n=2 Tax=Polystyrenella longa TaxID=2528007 RepID=A0A518CGZ3_9PLAN|nr:CAAX amino terminal protease self- immunity [Polystyrenella longa]
MLEEESELLPETEQSEPVAEHHERPIAPVRPDPEEASRNFLGTAYRIQVGMILIGLAIGGFLARPPWELFDWNIEAILWGTLGTIPLAILMFALDYIPYDGLRRIEDLLVNKIAPLVGAATIKKLFLLALLVGLGEELIFRGIVQNFLMTTMNVHYAILLSSILFAFCHFISPTYIILVFGVSLYLGYSAIGFSSEGELNLVPPVLIHTFYDFFAFVYILKKHRDKVKSKADMDAGANEE